MLSITTAAINVLPRPVGSATSTLWNSAFFTMLSWYVRSGLFTGYIHVRAASRSTAGSTCVGGSTNCFPRRNALLSHSLRRAPGASSMSPGAVCTGGTCSTGDSSVCCTCRWLRAGATGSDTSASISCRSFSSASPSDSSIVSTSPASLHTCAASMASSAASALVSNASNSASMSAAPASDIVYVHITLSAELWMYKAHHVVLKLREHQAQVAAANPLARDDFVKGVFAV